MIADARCFVPNVDGEDSEFEAEEVEDMLAECDFVLEIGNEEIAIEIENGRNYKSSLSLPPNRRKSAESAHSVDLWSAGVDPWRREITSNVAEKFRYVESPVTSTSGFADRCWSPSAPTSASIATRTLFVLSGASYESSATPPPPAPVEVLARPTRTMSASLSVPEAKRE